jgi:oligopeptide transport system permease protein
MKDDRSIVDIDANNGTGVGTASADPHDFSPLKLENAAYEREKNESPSLNFMQDSWRRIRKNRSALISMVVLVLLIGVAFTSIWLFPHDPNRQNLAHSNLPPKIPGVTVRGFDGTAADNSGGGAFIDKYAAEGVPEGVYYYLGTDNLGRDLLARLLGGMRVSLLIAFVAAFLDLTIGVTYGLVSGLFGERVDSVMQRILEVLAGIPNLVVLILMLTIFKPGIFTIILAMIVTGWISMARIVRAQTMKLKNQEYVLAAVTLGQSKAVIAAKHILPNISGVVIVQMMFSIPQAIFFEAFLSFIGLGLRPPEASLGTLLNEGYKAFRVLPYQMWVPTVTLSVLMISFNLLADGLRDAFDPKMKE